MDGATVCGGCGQPMVIGRACTITHLTIGDERFSRLPLDGESDDWWVGAEPASECHDCAVITGQLHHVGCDMEQCPRCGIQLLGCDCTR